jgi:hypothetical protein
MHFEVCFAEAMSVTLEIFLTSKNSTAWTAHTDTITDDWMALACIMTREY